MAARPGTRCSVREATAADVAELARLRWDFRVQEQPGRSRAEFLRDFES